jgi:hypothetical protein
LDLTEVLADTVRRVLERLQLSVAQSIPPPDVAVVFVSCMGVSLLL